ncbi:Guanidinobutyrase [subsurface metagenome]
MNQIPTFVEAPRCESLEDLDADVAIIGIPYKSPYEVSVPLDAMAGTLSAPEALRKQSVVYTHSLRHYDFDFDGDLFAGRDVKIADCGDLVLEPGSVEKQLQVITQAIRTILLRGAVPVVLGGDHGTPIPILKAYENHGPICVVQIDAHLDFRDERQGYKDGFSSQMRRAAEMAWVQAMMQIGLRGVGSGRQEEYEAARKHGSVMVRAQELHQLGVEQVLQRLPEADGYYITIDGDGLDPSIAPGVYYPSPGGVDYFEMTDLVKGIAKRGAIAGIDFCEVVPDLDVRNLTSIFAARLILNFIGAMAHSGQIG